MDVSFTSNEAWSLTSLQHHQQPLPRRRALRHNPILILQQVIRIVIEYLALQQPIVLQTAKEPTDRLQVPVIHGLREDQHARHDSDSHVTGHGDEDRASNFVERNGEERAIRLRYEVGLSSNERDG